MRQSQGARIELSGMLIVAVSPLVSYSSCLLFVLRQGGVLGTSFLEGSWLSAVPTGGLELSRRSSDLGGSTGIECWQ